MENRIDIRRYNFPIDISEYNIICSIENARFKIISSNHGIFTKSFQKHFHSFYELHYITGGKGTLITDDGEYALSEGCAYLVGPRCNHTQITDPNNFMEEFHLSFDVRLNKNHNKIFDDLIKTNLGIGNDVYDMITSFNSIEQELRLRHPGWTLSVETLFSRIIIALLRNISLNDITPVMDAIPNERRLIMIDDAFLYSHKNLTLESLANLVHLSPRQVQRMIKTKYGISFTALRHQVRMNAAIDLLTNSPKLSVKGISEKVGFETEAYFSKKFKDFFGISPIQYRDKIQ